MKTFFYRNLFLTRSGSIYADFLKLSEQFFLIFVTSETGRQIMDFEDKTRSNVDGVVVVVNGGKFGSCKQLSKSLNSSFRTDA